MARSVSPRKKMTLRKKLKPPKPFAGEVLDDVSSSILGDRSLDSSELEETSVGVLSTAPGPINSVSSRDIPAKKVPSKSPLSKKALNSPAEKVPFDPPLSKKAPVDKQPTAPKKPQFGQEAPRSGITTPKVPFNAWKPGCGMTPKKNTKYLGLQTQFNETLPPAAFPTLDTEELVQAWERGKSPYHTPKRPRQHAHDGNAQSSLLSSARTSHGRGSRQQDVKDSSHSQRTQSEMRSRPAIESFPESPAQTAGNDNRTTAEIWDGLSIYWRLEIVDSIASAFDPPPDAYQIFHVLRLTHTQIKATEMVLLVRSHQIEAENRAHEETTYEVTQYLMKKNIAVSEDKFRNILDNTIYKNTGQDDQLETNPNDRQDAVSLLSKVNLKSELLYDAIQPFTPFQQKITRLNKPQLGGSKGFQPNSASGSGSRERSFSVLKPQPDEGASNTYIHRATPPRIDPMANALHQTPGAPYDTNRALKTNVQAVGHFSRSLMQGSQISTTNATAIRGQAMEDVIPSSQNQYKPQDQISNASVKSDPGSQAGTTLTGGGGLSGIVGSDIPKTSGPVGDLSHEDWSQKMDRRYQKSEKLIDKHGKAFTASLSFLGGGVNGRDVL